MMTATGTNPPQLTVTKFVMITNERHKICHFRDSEVLPEAPITGRSFHVVHNTFLDQSNFRTAYGPPAARTLSEGR
jgi:hypothetical protein